ncbi:hypothetical protein GWI33_007670 [Rhynchophorus ferrugineus]|uniref:Ig-like domain-containing protein n=1 Tax=Rhynchophorus ferrugineus TaxID=354439 RepID=A0A834MGG5_RHYFE|nr:hypothetical protein GWI33_007670 [Rhynchophorus ferrugineus]
MLSNDNIFISNEGAIIQISRSISDNLLSIVPSAIVRIVSPSSVQISDSLGPVKKDTTEAYAEGASITLTCTATGGKPLARVSV